MYIRNPEVLLVYLSKGDDVYIIHIYIYIYILTF